jgi:hypothetical protein
VILSNINCSSKCYEEMECNKGTTGKVARTSEDNYSKAWIKKPKKTGGVQLSCNNNIASARTTIQPGLIQRLDSLSKK